MKLVMTVVWALPFLLSGVAAPVLFTHIESRKIAGHYAGALFIFSGIWFVLLSFLHHYVPAIKVLAGIFLLLSLLFWSWRFRSEGPLEQSKLLGLNGDLWHHGLTAIYFVCLCALLYSEYRRQKI